MGRDESDQQLMVLGREKCDLQTILQHNFFQFHLTDPILQTQFPAF